MIGAHMCCFAYIAAYVSPMHPNRLILILAVAAVGPVAAPALASAPAKPRPDDAVFPAPKRAAATVASAGRDARRRQRHRRESREPVHPLTVAPDYGTAENAFGAARSGHMHTGQDIFAPAGTPLVAVTQSVVAESSSDGGQGNYVYLYDEDADRTYVYMHMQSPSPLKVGDAVEPGEEVGELGCTGSCWGDHLHFEVRSGKGYTGEAQDPLPLLKSWDRVSD